MPGQMTIKGLHVAKLRTSEAGVGFMADANTVLLAPHPAGDLFRGSARPKSILDRRPQLRARNPLSMNPAATFIFVFGIDRVVAAIMRKCGARIHVPLQFPTDCRWAREPVCNIRHRQAVLVLFGNFPIFFEARV
jgi:hypothetical protein